MFFEKPRGSKSPLAKKNKSIFQQYSFTTLNAEISPNLNAEITARKMLWKMRKEVAVFHTKKITLYKVETIHVTLILYLKYDENCLKVPVAYCDN